MPVVGRFQGQIVSLYRIVVGLLFLCHGASSLFGVLGGSFGKGISIPVGSWPGWWAALIQFVTGALVLLGLGTRVAALLASGSMAYAYFSVHVERGLFPIQNGGELAALFCWSFLLLVVAGPGPWSIDAMINRSRRTPVASSPVGVTDQPA